MVSASITLKAGTVLFRATTLERIASVTANRLGSPHHNRHQSLLRRLQAIRVQLRCQLRCQHHSRLCSRPRCLLASLLGNLRPRQLTRTSLRAHVAQMLTRPSRVHLPVLFRLAHPHTCPPHNPLLNHLVNHPPSLLVSRQLNPRVGLLVSRRRSHPWRLLASPRADLLVSQRRSRQACPVINRQAIQH